MNGYVSDFIGVKPKKLDGRKARRKNFKVVTIPPGTGLERDEDGTVKQVRVGTGKGASKRAFAKPQIAKGKGARGFVRGDRIFVDESEVERLRPMTPGQVEAHKEQAHREMLLQLKGKSSTRKYGEQRS